MNWKKLFGFGNREEQNVDFNEAGISDDALTIINKVSDERLRPFYKTVLYSDKDAELAGVYLETNEEESELLLSKLMKELEQVGYQAFLCDSERKKVAIIKGSDQFDILKVQQTNGDNYDIDNEEVIRKIKDWYNRYPFTIVGADFDWVEANFDVFPSNNELKSFAKEIYKFCPDVVDQGAGSIEEFIEEMKETKKLYLWWD